MDDGRLMITGADGYLGRRLVQHYLRSTDRELLLWVRATNPAEAEARCAATVDPCRVAPGRIRYAGGDLTGPDPFAGVATKDVTAMVHTAAVTAFTVTDSLAGQVNVTGTARLLDLARDCPRLRTVCLLSSLYATGVRAGPVPERPVDDAAGFANAYERSKWAAEGLARASALPVSVLRLATVVADDATGRIGQHNAVHNTLKLLRLGLLALMPGRPTTPVYLITADTAVRAVAAAVDTAATGVVHVADRAPESLTLGATLDVAFDVFGTDPGFARRRVPRPEYADLHSFELLADSAKSFGTSVLGQALGSLLPFARQLFVTKDVANDRLRALLPDYRPADPAAVLAATCRELLRAGDHRAPR